MFQHFKALSITPADLRAKYAGQTGVWQAFAPPSRDEIGFQAPLGYYEGLFEDVRHAVILEHRRSFLDGQSCGEIIPVLPKRIPPQTREPRPDAIERVLHLMHECETCTGYGDPETIRIFRGVAQRIREAVYGEPSKPSRP